MEIAALLAEGVDLHVAGCLAAAVDRYTRVIELAPRQGQAWRLLGIVALQAGDAGAARPLLERAIDCDAADAPAWSALGNLDELAGSLDAAAAKYARACASDSTLTVAFAGAARVMLAQGRFAQARDVAAAAARRGIADAGLLRTLGAAALSLDQTADGIDALQRSLEREPHPDAFANLGAAYVHQERDDAALAACRAALALEPNHPAALNSLGSALAGSGDFPAADAAFERAIAAGSDEAHLNLGTLRLLLGDYRGGWPHFGWPTAERRANPIATSLPLWDGTPGAVRLLIWPEQGVGDTIQFARFASRARTLVGSLTLACPAGTRALFATLAGVDALVDAHDPGQLDRFDCWLPAVRLPLVCGATLDGLSGQPYLGADPERVARFRPRIAAHPGPRVGLVWSGNPRHQRDAARSCGLAAFEPLASVAGVSWFALQHGPARAQRPPAGLQLVEINAEVADFADTAAIVAQLDLVITVDTSVAHLAGALGRPAWVLIPRRPDWRWLRAGETTPWYPVLRLFRQRPDAGWEPVVADVATALRWLCAEHDATERDGRIAGGPR